MKWKWYLWIGQSFFTSYRYDWNVQHLHTYEKSLRIQQLTVNSTPSFQTELVFNKPRVFRWRHNNLIFCEAGWLQSWPFVGCRLTLNLYIHNFQFFSITNVNFRTSEERFMVCNATICRLKANLLIKGSVVFLQFCNIASFFPFEKAYNGVTIIK